MLSIYVINKLMKILFHIFFFILILFGNAYGNIVDQLTELNNLYKSGAINEDEFSKAKNILLKSETDEKIEAENKIKTEEKKKYKNN